MLNGETGYFNCFCVDGFTGRLCENGQITSSESAMTGLMAVVTERVTEEVTGFEDKGKTVTSALVTEGIVTEGSGTTVENKIMSTVSESFTEMLWKVFF